MDFLTGAAAERADSATIEEFANFYRSDFSRAISFLMMSGATAEDARDAVQDAFIHAYKVWGSITSPKAWIRKVAFRELLRQRRGATIPDPGGDYDSPAQDAADHSIEHDEVIRLLSLLPRNQRAALALYYDGFTRAEIAEALGIGPATVRVHLHRARAHLRHHLACDDKHDDDAVTVGDT